MNVLALDLSSCTGWCFGDDADGTVRVLGGVCDFRPRASRRLDGLTRQAVIFDRAALALSDLVDQCRPTAVALEDSGSSLRGEAGRVLLGLRAVVLLCCYRREILVDPITASAWKAWARQQPGGWTEADKSDRADAEMLCRYWLAVRAERVREAA